jgi:hypothetical protein
LPGAPTPNLGLTVPTVGGDTGIWGPEVNANWAILDGLGAYPPVVLAATGTIPLASPLPPITFVQASGGAAGIVLSIPAPSSFAGRLIGIKKVDATNGAVVLNPLSGMIDGAANYTLFNYGQYVLLYSDGSNLYIFGNN